MSELAIIKANWKAPENIIAFTTTRQDGVSAAPFASLNLGGRSGDKTDAVEMNRQRLIQSARLAVLFGYNKYMAIRLLKLMLWIIVIYKLTLATHNCLIQFAPF